MWRRCAKRTFFSNCTAKSTAPLSDRKTNPISIASSPSRLLLFIRSHLNTYILSLSPIIIYYHSNLLTFKLIWSPSPPDGDDSAAFHAAFRAVATGLQRPPLHLRRCSRHRQWLQGTDASSSVHSLLYSASNPDPVPDSLIIIVCVYLCCPCCCWTCTMMILTYRTTTHRHRRIDTLIL